MAASQSDFQKHFSELSDAALFEVERQDLVAAAAVFYDQEMTLRGLTAETASPATELSGGEDLVNVVEFESAEDAERAQQQLKKNGIPAYIAVAVPAAFAKQAINLLDPGVSEEELARLAESTPLPDEEKDA
jgi:hypothetical protein